jgi:hypothetical protein
MGDFRIPGRTCYVYLDEAGAARFISVSCAEEMVAWDHVLEGKWAELEGYEVLNTAPGVTQWAAIGRD